MNFKDIFKELNIDVKPLSTDYTPDKYARELMRDTLSPDNYNFKDISYSTSTDYKKAY